MPALSSPRARARARVRVRVGVRVRVRVRVGARLLCRVRSHEGECVARRALGVEAAARLTQHRFGVVEPQHAPGEGEGEGSSKL